jgi:hypothetical protein
MAVILSTASFSRRENKIHKAEWCVFQSNAFYDTNYSHISRQKESQDSGWWKLYKHNDQIKQFHIWVAWDGIHAARITKTGNEFRPLIMKYQAETSVISDWRLILNHHRTFSMTWFSSGSGSSSEVEWICVFHKVGYFLTSRIAATCPLENYMYKLNNSHKIITTASCWLQRRKFSTDCHT